MEQKLNDFSKLSPNDFALIKVIVERVADIIKRFGAFIDAKTLSVDLAVVHCYDRELDFARLMLTPNDVVVIHDCSLIFHNIDRKTGRLPTFVRLHSQKENPLSAIGAIDTAQKFLVN